MQKSSCNGGLQSQTKIFNAAFKNSEWMKVMLGVGYVCVNWDVGSVLSDLKAYTLS
jgi:hypothetical protein